MVVEHLPHQPKVKGLFPATIADTRRTQSFYKNELSGGSMVVEHLSHQTKVKGSSLATTADTGELKVFTKMSRAGAEWW